MVKTWEKHKTTETILCRCFRLRVDTARTARFLPQSPGPSSHCRHHHHRRRLLLLRFRAPQVGEAWDHAHHELTARYDRLHREHQRLQDRLQETAHAVEVGHMQSAALEAQMAAADRESVARVRELEDEAGLLREEVEVSRAELGQALAEHALVQRAREQERARLLNPGTSPPSPRGDEATEDWEAKCHLLQAEVQRLEEAGARARGSEAETQAARWREERAGPQELPRDSEGQRTPLPIRSPEQPPHEKGRDIPPGIARMLQQIRMPQARPQPLQPRREPRPNARTSRTAVLPTGPPMGFNVTSTPSPRVLSRPRQFSPSPAWSPAVTSSWHSVRHVSPEHWSPACTPGGGSDRQQDSPHLPPVLLAPLFESAMSTPRRDGTQGASDEDVQQYAVRCSTPPDLPPTLLAPLFESVMSASRAGSTHRECDEDMGQYEVHYSTPPSVGEWPPSPFTFPSLRGAQRLCTELPSMARQGQGWVRDPHARHSTMLYSMQEGALSPNSAEGLMKHGRASREAT